MRLPVKSHLHMTSKASVHRSPSPLLFCTSNLLVGPALSDASETSLLQPHQGINERSLQRHLVSGLSTRLHRHPIALHHSAVAKLAHIVDFDQLQERLTCYSGDIQVVEMSTFKKWKVDLDTNENRRHVPDPPGLDSSSGRELVSPCSPESSLLPTL